METVGTGTLTENPLSFPFSSGRTSATAFAAIVVVGIIFCAAVLGRLRSLCLLSSICDHCISMNCSH